MKIRRRRQIERGYGGKSHTHKPRKSSRKSQEKVALEAEVNPTLKVNPSAYNINIKALKILADPCGSSPEGNSHRPGRTI